MIEFYERYSEVLSVGTDIIETKAEHLMAEMQINNINQAVVHAEYEFGEDPAKLNENLAKLIEQFPNQLFGFGTVDLTILKPLTLVGTAEKIKAYGFKGINLQPIFFDVDPLDRRLYPLYATAERLGLIVSFHTGVHYSLKSSFINNNPLFIDQIAVDFPTLKIMACHAGWPWVGEMAAVARRHQNVYLEFGGLDPKYIAMPGSGWETIFTLMNNLLSDQILFGTDWPVIRPHKAIESWQNLGLKEEVLDKLFVKNARTFLGLEV